MIAECIHGRQISFVSDIAEALALLVFRVHCTQHEHFVPTLDHLAVLAQAANCRPHLHCSTLSLSRLALITPRQ